MAGERRFTRIPPESSGDRINMGVCLEVKYNGKTTSFSVGDTVDLTTSGISGDVSYVREDTGTAGVIVIQLDDTSRETNLVVTDGENIQVSAVTYATAVAAGSHDLYTNKNIVVSEDNDQYGQKVDRFGAAHMRFTEGPAQLDAFGKLRTSQSYVIGDYIFTSDLLPGYMTPTTATGGTVTHDDTAGCALLSTTTSADSSADFTSNLYHPYFPGIATTILLTMYAGDSGKNNLVREWGYFNELNGVFFRLSGTTLSVVRRSNITGTAVDDVIDQADWNIDTVDGTKGFNNASQINLDVTNLNLYWIDFSWLGAGTVRWGIYAGGERITVHEETYGNMVAGPYMKSANLPICFRQDNSGGATGSSSEMRVVCSGVHTEQLLSSPSQYGNNLLVPMSSVSVNTTADIYVHSFRTTANTHDTFLPLEVVYMATEGANDATIQLDYYLGSTLSGASWTQWGTSNFEYDTSGSLSVAGTLTGFAVVKGFRAHEIKGQSLQHFSYKSYANGDPYVVTVVATRLDGVAANCDVRVHYQMKEFKSGYG